MKISKTLLSLFALILFGGAAAAQDPVPLYPDNYKVVLENDKVRVLDFQLKKGAKENFHAHPAAVTYVLAPFKIRFTFLDGTTKIREAKAGDVFYGDALVHASENIGDTDAHGLLVAMKKGTVAGAMNEFDLLTAVTFIRGPEGAEQELLTELYPPRRRLAPKQETLNTTCSNQRLTRIISCGSRFGGIRKRLRITSSRRISRPRSKDARIKVG